MCCNFPLLCQKPAFEPIRFNSVVKMHTSLNPPLNPIFKFPMDLYSPNTATQTNSLGCSKAS